MKECLVNHAEDMLISVYSEEHQALNYVLIIFKAKKIKIEILISYYDA